MSSLPLSDHFGLCAAGNFGGDQDDDLRQLVGASTSSVLLDGNDAQELGAAVSKEETGKKGERAENKAATALKKNRSEAERRRRERINAHLATLRGMVPCPDKMDKAALLAEVITHVKKLKTDAARISSHCPVPADADEVTIELVHQDATATATSSSSSHGSSGGGGGFLFKATLSCDDGADLFASVKDALRPLRGLKVVGSDVTTLGGRVRFTFFLMSTSSAARGGGDDDLNVVESVRQALQAVLDKANSALEFAPRTSLLNKRRRVSTFESSSSSS